MGSDLTQGTLIDVVWRMSWPLVVTMLGCAVVDLVRVHIAGMLSAPTQAAVGFAEHILMIAVLVATAIANGTAAVVARAFGAKDLNGAIVGTAQSLRIASVIGAGLAVAAFALSKLVLPYYSESPEVIREAADYLGLACWHLIPFSIMCSINAAFRGLGLTKVQLQVSLVLLGTDVLANYALVALVWPHVNLGIGGVAFAANLSSSAAMLFALYKLNRSGLAAAIANVDQACWSSTKHILHIGLPCALLELSRMTSAFVLFFVLSRCAHPAQAVASWALGMRLEAFVFLPLDALALAAAAIVAQNLGARRTARAWSASCTIMGLSIAMMIAASTAMFILAEAIAGAGSSDGEVVSFTSAYLRLNAICEPFLALEVILGAILQSMGDSRVPMSIGFVSNWMVRLPAAALLALGIGLGPAGVWLAMTISNTLAGLLMLIRFGTNSTWAAFVSALVRPVACRLVLGHGMAKNV